MTVTAATLDLTTAYYIVDSADDMLTAEELALRPAAEALIAGGPSTAPVVKADWEIELDRKAAEAKAEREAWEAGAAEREAAAEAELAAEYGDETIARVKDWFNKYDKYSSVERSSLAEGILKYFLDSGFILDAIEPSEEEALIAHVMSEESVDEDEAADMVASGEAFAEFGKEVAPITYAAFRELEEATGLEGEEAAAVVNEII